MKNIYVGIMAGGIGSRFWPMSRNDFPKQFLDILGTGESLLQSTFKRFSSFIPESNIYFITSSNYADLIHEQIPQISKEQILSEPIRRNTAPCIAYFSNKIHSKDKDAILMIAPSDHIVLDSKSFEERMMKAAHYASENDNLITLGIQPSRPDTGYGYIQYRKKQELAEDVFQVKTFTEKPQLEMAKTFLESGDFLWNAGIFVWSAKAILKSFDKHLVDVAEVFKNEDSYNCSKEEGFIENAYALSKSVSIDYGIMEKAENVVTIPSDFGWSDLGTWRSMYENLPKDDHGNAISQSDVLLYESKDNLVRVPGGKLAILVGLEDFYVVDTGDVLLVCKKDQEQMIKAINSDVKNQKGDQFV